MQISHRVRLRWLNIFKSNWNVLRWAVLLPASQIPVIAMCIHEEIFFPCTLVGAAQCNGLISHTFIIRPYLLTGLSLRLKNIMCVCLSCICSAWYEVRKERSVWSLGNTCIDCFWQKWQKKILFVKHIFVKAVFSWSGCLPFGSCTLRYHFMIYWYNPDKDKNNNAEFDF